MMKLLRSFKYAGRGFLHCVRNERNFRIHITAAMYALALGRALDVSRSEWAALILTIAVVLSAECMNTAIENAVEITTKTPHPLARAAKDAAAGAVLVCAAASLAVAGVVFWKPAEIAALVSQITDTPWRLVMIVASVLLSALFVFYGGSKDRVSDNRTGKL